MDGWTGVDKKEEKIQWLSHGTPRINHLQASSKVLKCSAVLTADSSGVAQRLKKGEDSQPINVHRIFF